MKLLLIFFSGALIALAGCATAGQSPPSPPPSSPVALLFAVPPEDFMIVGEVTSTGALTASDEALYYALQQEAEKRNAHAVVLKYGKIRVVRQDSGTIKRADAYAIRYINGIPEAREKDSLSEPVPPPSSFNSSADYKDF